MTGTTEIAEYNMSIGVDEDVLGFKVSVNNITCVSMLDGKKLGEQISAGQNVELIGSQAPPCKIVQLLHQVSASFEGLGDRLQEGTPTSTMSKEKHEVGYMHAHRNEVVVLSVVKACMKRENKVIPIQLGEGSLLILNRAPHSFSPSSGVLDGFESIQVRRTLLSHEINSRIASRTQDAQDLVIIEARRVEGAVSIDTANGTLEGKFIRGLIVNQTGRRARTYLYRARPRMTE